MLESGQEPSRADRPDPLRLHTPLTEKMIGGHEPTRNGALHEGGGKGQLDDVAGHGHGREQRRFGHRYQNSGAPRPGTRSEPRAVIAHQVAVVENASGTSLGVERMEGAEKFLFRAGVVIGVSAVIMMVALVEGIRASIVGEFERLGTDLIIIAFDPNPGDFKGARTLDYLTLSDVAAIKAECDLLKAVSSEVPVGTAKIRFKGKEVSASTTGVEEDYTRVRNASVSLGRFISDEDIERWSKK